MPAIAPNETNSLIKILRLGLLRERHTPPAGHDGGLGYGLNGSDISSLQRTCKTAHASLRMSKTAQINYLARVIEPMLLPPPTPQQVNRAKTYLRHAVDRNVVTPRGVYEAMGEMFDVGTRAFVAKSSADERHVAIVFSGLMHAQSGYMADPALANFWLYNMRGLSNAHYRSYIDRCQRQILHDGAKLALRAGSVVATGVLIKKAAVAAAHGSLAAKIAAGISAPILAVMASQALITVVTSAPLAVGIASFGLEIAQERTAYAQINFYKDAVLFDSLMYQGSPLLNMRDTPMEFHLFIQRFPENTEARGQRMMDQFGRRLLGYG